MINPGQRLPAFHLTAVASQRVVTPASAGGAPLVLLFHNHQTLSAVRKLQAALRQGPYPRPADAFVAQVVDLRIVPRSLRPVAEAAMRRAYDDAARMLTPDLDPADIIVILPDWDGAVSRLFGVADAGQAPVVVVAGGDGRIVGSHRGPAVGEAALTLLAQWQTKP